MESKYIQDLVKQDTIRAQNSRYSNLLKRLLECQAFELICVLAGTGLIRLTAKHTGTKYLQTVDKQMMDHTVLKAVMPCKTCQKQQKVVSQTISKLLSEITYICFTYIFCSSSNYMQSIIS